jgi:hypothetical protein
MLLISLPLMYLLIDMIVRLSVMLSCRMCLFPFMDLFARSSSNDWCHRLLVPYYRCDSLSWFMLLIMYTLYRTGMENLLVDYAKEDTDVGVAMGYTAVGLVVLIATKTVFLQAGMHYLFH